MNNTENREFNLGRYQAINLGLWLTVLGCVAQLTIELSLANIIAVVLALGSWPIALHTFLSKRHFSQQPLTSLIVIGFWVTQIILPILATAIEGNSTTVNLKVPELVFLHNALLFILLLSAWEFQRRLGTRKQRIDQHCRYYLGKIGLYTTATPSFLYFLGFVGLSAMFYIKFYLPSMEVTAAGVFQKFIQGLVPFVYAPFLVFFGELYGSKINWRRHILIISAFSVLLVLISVGGNSRASFMNTILFVGIAYGVGLLSGIYRKQVLSGRLFVALSLGVFLLNGPVADLATAMVLVRGERDDVQRGDLVKLTWDAYNDKEKIHQYRSTKQGTLSSGRWDESYVSNPFLSRFCNLKFADLSLDMEMRLSDDSRSRYLDYTGQRLLATYPQPIIDFFELPVDKSFVNSFGWGDYLFYLAEGNSNVLGGFRVGHIAGTGKAAFGWFYLPIFFVSVTFSFILISFLQQSSGVFWRFTPISLIFLSSFFMFIQNAASVAEIITFLLRGWWESVFLYGILWVGYHFFSFEKSKLPKLLHCK